MVEPHSAEPIWKPRVAFQRAPVEATRSGGRATLA